MNSFPHVFQFPAYPFYRSDTEFNLKGKWNKDFFQNDFPIILELGCGKENTPLDWQNFILKKISLALISKEHECGQVQNIRLKSK